MNSLPCNQASATFDAAFSGSAVTVISTTSLKLFSLEAVLSISTSNTTSVAAAGEATNFPPLSKILGSFDVNDNLAPNLSSNSGTTKLVLNDLPAMLAKEPSSKI